MAWKQQSCFLLQLFTKAWTAGLLNGLGDLVSQKFVEKNDDLDLKRLGIFTLLASHPFVSMPDVLSSPAHAS